MEERKRSINFSRKELDTLMDSLQFEPDLASSREGWQKVTDCVNAAGSGKIRSVEDVRRKWKDLKYLAKKRATEIKLSTIGPGDHPELTDMELRVLSIAGSITSSNNTSIITVTKNNGSSLSSVKNNRTSFDCIIENVDHTEEVPESRNHHKVAASTLRVQAHRERKRKLADDQCTEDLNTLIASNQQIAQSLHEIAADMKDMKKMHQETLDLRRKEIKLKCLKYGFDFDEL